MAKVIILIGLVFTFIACSFNESSKTKAFHNTDNCFINNGKNSEKHTSSILVEDSFEEIVEMPELFKNAIFNDTLLAFIKSTDSVPNPYGAPKFNLLTFEKKKKDTIFHFTVGIGLYIILDNNIHFLKGGYKVGNEYVAVYYTLFNKLDNVINEDILDIEYIKKADMFYENDEGEWYEWDNLNPTEWIYKLSGDSLIVIKKHTKKIIN